MSATLGALAGLAVFSRTEGSLGRKRAAVAAIGVGMIPPALPLGLAVLTAAAAARLRGRLRTRRLGDRAAEADLALLADLVALGLRAGLGLIQALQRAADDVTPRLAAEVHGVVRRAGRSGTAVALAEAEGHAGRLYRLAARAAATGAPLAEAVEAYAAERRHADHARAAERARRLPVRMLLPLALLILPGFVVLAVGPALLEALERLQLAP